MDERGDPLRADSELGDFIALSVDIIARLVIGLLKTLADESQKPSIAETFEEGVRAEGFRVDGHDDSDAERWG